MCVTEAVVAQRPLEISDKLVYYKRYLIEIDYNYISKKTFVRGGGESVAYSYII